MERKSRKEDYITVLKKFDDSNIHKFTDLNSLGKRLINPYKLGIKFCLLGCFGLMATGVIMIKSYISAIFVILGLVLAIISVILKNKKKKIERNIYMWGVEETWIYYKNKK